MPGYKAFKAPGGPSLAGLPGRGGRFATAGQGVRQVFANFKRRVEEYANDGTTACAETAQSVARQVAERYPAAARSAP
jgi:hypothetical protein